MKIYHGSTEIVSSPEIRETNRTLDYGSGFYTTTSFEQAQAWVKRRMDENYIMNITVSQDNLYLLIPSKMCWLTNMLAEDRGISIADATKILYSSAFYSRLADESTKLWHLGPVALYEEFLSEQSAY